MDEDELDEVTLHLATGADIPTAFAASQKSNGRGLSVKAQLIVVAVVTALSSGGFSADAAVALIFCAQRRKRAAIFGPRNCPSSQEN